MAHTLNFKHGLIEINGVPDNLRIVVGEKFTLEVADPVDGEHFEWYANRDPILEEVPTAVPGGSEVMTFRAASVGRSVIQLQVAVGEAETTIDRRYKVEVVAKEATSATLASRGNERLGAENE